MLNLIDLAVVVAAGYFLSRWLGRTGRFSPNRAGVFAVHAVSGLAIIALAVAVKQLMAGIMPQNLVLVPVAQAIWLVWDLLRAKTPAALD